MWNIHRFICAVWVFSTVAVDRSQCENIYTHLIAEWSKSVLGNEQFPDLLINSQTEENGFKIGRRVRRQEQFSETCYNQLRILKAAVIAGESWALEMMDASAKPPSGIMKGNVIWLGSYDQCKNVTAMVYHGPEDNHTVEYPFVGHYCMSYIGMEQTDLAELKIGFCVPSGCSDEDITIVMQQVLAAVMPYLENRIAEMMHVDNQTVFVPRVSCEKKPDDFNTTAIASISVISLFVALMIAATCYDVFYLTLIKNGKLNPGTFSKLLLSFSVYTNTLKIMNTKQSANSLSALSGIRFLSISWLVFGHTFLHSVLSIANVQDVFDAIQQWSYKVLVNAGFAVDSFFALSGILVAYMALKEMKKRNGCINFPLFYFHRYWRLTPPYMFFIMVYVPLLQYWGDGPMWPRTGIAYNYCKTTWWTNLLYINNFVGETSARRTCMPGSWYLANDMQFYLLSPLLFIPLYYSKIVGGIVCFAFLLAASIISGVLSVAYDLPSSHLSSGLDTGLRKLYFSAFYNKPYCRMGPYIIGIITGYILFKTDRKVQMNPLVVAMGWIVASVCCLSIIYGRDTTILNNDTSAIESILHNALSRTAWSISVCWVVFACATGYGGVVDSFLSWGLWIPLSRLTYCIYIVHPVIIKWYNARLRSAIYFTAIDMVYLFFGHLVISVGAALIVSLTFEAPMMGIEKVILRRNVAPSEDKPTPITISSHGIEQDKQCTTCNRHIEPQSQTKTADHYKHDVEHGNIVLRSKCDQRNKIYLRDKTMNSAQYTG